ncbi:hypothetical protein TNIN_16301 [Trichonephila inaurata madagascariensis]|uniref:Uncharacterized protein n=1 Tax=Trichonephila inaurata madagascariensis TaxID=2747483 RepID=A0A8X7CIF4_9ARAC|nr:hypothetical protein TNIN_16301 [Trichonephila inaurata madagascariensis]
MKRIRTVDKNIKKFESLILKHKTGAHTEGYKSSLKRSRKTRETLVRELQLLAPCTVPDCPIIFLPAGSLNARKNPHSEEIKSKLKISKAQKRKDSQDDFVFPKKTVRPNSPIKTPEPVPVSDCARKQTICNEIEGHGIVASHYKDLDKTPDTAENHEMKEILRAALKDILQKKADLKMNPVIKKLTKIALNLLRSLPPPRVIKIKPKEITKNAKLKRIPRKTLSFPKKPPDLSLLWESPFLLLNLVRNEGITGFPNPQSNCTNPTRSRFFTQFHPSDLTSPLPPPPPLDYYDSPASQSGSFLLPTQDFQHSGNIHYSLMGRGKFVPGSNKNSVKYFEDS